MQKDVIYIDIEDDITAIIGRVKNASNKIVALVPPKRIGVLQSAVNLKLLQRAANDTSKRLVLITNDRSLVALAAGLSIPVAKNLQSKPEVPQVTGPQIAEEEVIDGENLPIAEFADQQKEKSVADTISERVELADTPSNEPGSAQLEPTKLARPKNKSIVPDFLLFRKRLFIIGGLGAALIIFLVWAIGIAPHAKIVVTAKTTAVNVDRTLTLDPAMPTSDPGQLKLKSVAQQVKKSVVTEFDATGSKEIGNKASGTIQVRNCDVSDDFDLPAGTKFTSASGHVFVSTQMVTVPQFSGSSSSCTQSGSASGKASVPVQANALGPDYNIAAQAYSVSGFSNKVDGVGSEMTGGTRETVKVVSQEDVDKAKAQLPQVDETAARAELRALFGSDAIVIDESYELTKGDEVITPNIGEQATRAKITKETTLTLTGLMRTDVQSILQSVVDTALKDKLDQQVYSYGESSITFQTYQKAESGAATSRMVTTAAIGPKIDSAELAKKVAGKRYGEVQAIISDINGVDKVDITFSPFWVTTAPAPGKIDIEFSVANGQP